MLFDESTLRKLEQLALIADKVRAGVMKGDRRSKKRGTSIEFADYRNYVKGDDLRRLDWNVYARLERPFIKLLEEEEDLAVHVLVDNSLSMDWPRESEGDFNKLIYALKLAGALGHVALATGDQLTVSLLRSDEDLRWGPYRGQQNSLRLFQFLENGSQGVGITDLNLSLTNYAVRGRRPGLLFVITDLMSPVGYQDGLRVLQGKGFEVGVLHVLSRDEIEPPLDGDYKLIDSETGVAAEVTLDATLLDEYRARVTTWQAEINAYCANRNIHYIPVTTDSPWDQLVLNTLRARGIVK
ncbi:MAG: DUF58 domain-containing protein [Chloroflexota bacterium]